MSLPETLFLLSEYVGVGTIFRLMRVSRACRSHLLDDPPLWVSVARRMHLTRPLDVAGVLDKMRSTVRCRECGVPRVLRKGPRVCAACAEDAGGYFELISFTRVREMTLLAKDSGGFVRSHRSVERDLPVIRRTRHSKRLVWRASVEALLAR